MLKVLYFILVLLWLQTSSAIASANFSTQKAEAENVRLLIEAGKYEEAYEEILPLFDKENVIAIHYLGIMKYFGLHVTKDLDIAARLFFTASKNGEEGGNLDSAYWLSRNFYLNPESPHFNEHEGIKLIYAAELSGHIESAFFNGVYTMSKLSSAKNKNELIRYAIQSFQVAYEGGKLEAATLWYILENELLEQDPTYVHSSYKALLSAANNPNELQAEAAYEIALLYKQGQYFEKSDKKYLEYLTVGANNGDVKSAYFLGKAYLIGIIGDPNYGEAAFYTQYAIDNAGNDDNLKIASESQLKLITRKKEEEEALSSFEAPRDVYLDILAMQHFINAQKHSPNKASSSIFDLPNDSIGKKQNPITTYNFSDEKSFAASGTTYRRTGDRIRGSDGSSYKISGDIMRGSDGSRYRLSNKTMRSSDGTSYRFVGNNIYGSNGSRCRISGRTTRCY